MTIRDLIRLGADLDMEICIQVRTYNEDGIRTGMHYFYKDISKDNLTFDSRTFDSRNLFTITVDIDEV